MVKHTANNRRIQHKIIIQLIIFKQLKYVFFILLSFDHFSNALQQSHVTKD